MAAKKKPSVVKERPTIRTWSPSIFGTWKDCARKAKYKVIDKLPDPGGAAMQRGNDIHEEAEQYIAGRRPDLSANLQKPKVKALIEKLRKKFKERLVRTEMFLAFDRNWKQLKDGSNANPEKWLGLKVDALELDKKAKLVVAYDWKTGKLKKEGDRLYEEYDEQVHLYNTAALSTGLGTEAQAELVFTDAGERVARPKLSLSLPVLKQAQEEWNDKVAPMLADKIFAPRPSNGCRWCPYSVNNNGPCEY